MLIAKLLSFNSHHFDYSACFYKNLDPHIVDSYQQMPGKPAAMTKEAFLPFDEYVNKYLSDKLLFLDRTFKS